MGNRGGFRGAGTGDDERKSPAFRRGLFYGLSARRSVTAPLGLVAILVRVILLLLLAGLLAATLLLAGLLVRILILLALTRLLILVRHRDLHGCK
jgi:hypothetical protein